MINEITIDRLNEFKDSLNKKQKSDLLFARLYANAVCFLPHNLCSLYEVTNNCKVCGVFCIYSSCATAFFTKAPDIDEFLDFLSFNASAQFLEISAKIGRKMTKKGQKTAVFGSFFTIKKVPKNIESELKISECSDVSKFFEVLKKSSESYNDTSYESYYCDYFYRKKLPASLYVAERGGKIISTLAVLHIFEKTAIISDVASLPAERRKGAASALIFDVCRKLLKKGLTPSLLCTEKSAAALYKKVGFKKGKNFALLMIKDEN